MTPLRGAVFDVDGVLVDSPHEKAWREALRELMENEWRELRAGSTWAPDAFTPSVYQQQLSGKPRMAGARAALAYFGIPDDDAHARQYAQRKQDMITRLIDAREFAAYPDGLRFIIAVRDAGVRVAAASSSKNAKQFLQRIRLDTFAQAQGIDSPSLRPGLTLLDYFDVDVSGRDFAHGKPDPEMFLTAVAELGVEPAAAFVVEDAAAGVHAAKAGGMSAIGVARAHDAQLLADAGADIVVASLDDVDRDALRNGRLATRVSGDAGRSRSEVHGTALERWDAR
jgi:beta-phosphoglucomutase